jgi:lipoic acid synthetase
MAIFKELPVLASHPVSQAGLDHPERPLSPSKAAEVAPGRKPDWLRIRPPSGDNYLRIKDMLRERKLHTVCEEAHCPNLTECWAGGTATFMLGSDICTRACRFCAVKTARLPPPLDPKEPEHVAESVVALGLKYVVLTSVDRDDREDGGAHHFAETIRAIKRRNPQILVEALVPDFRGDLKAVQTIVDSGLDVYAHNVETVARLQYRVRDPRAGYLQSLATLKSAKTYAQSRSQLLYTKSSIMLGLGEREDELLASFEDLRQFDVDVLTLGQYLRPSLQHLPVEKYYSPEEFKALETQAVSYGFLYVASGPMVRSSYKAAEFFLEGVIRKRKNESEASHEVYSS